MQNSTYRGHGCLSLSVGIQRLHGIVAAATPRTEAVLQAPQLSKVRALLCVALLQPGQRGGFVAVKGLQQFGLSVCELCTDAREGAPDACTAASGCALYVLPPPGEPVRN